MTLDPRAPRAATSVKKTEQGPVLLPWVQAVDMNADLLDAIAEAVANKVVEKLQEKKDAS